MTTRISKQNVVSLHDPAAIANLVCECGEQNLPIIDYGLAHQGVGHPPPADHIRLSQATPQAGIIEHYERDLTVRANAGATLGSLRDALKSSKQFLPIDADDDLTLGEVINHNVYGGLRVGYPGVRDLLLGLRYIDSYGQQIHVGGRTVKNVAGYDLTRLMVGSLGELGLIYEATLRTYAIPDSAMAVDIRFDDLRTFDQVLPDWMVSDASPASLIVGNHTGVWTARVEYFGGSTGLAVQLRSLETLIDHASGAHILGSWTRTVDQAIQECSSHGAWRRTANTLVKVVTSPSITGTICSALAETSIDHPALTVWAYPVHGCAFFGGDIGLERTIALSQSIDKLLSQYGGFRVWYARPQGCEHLPPFGPIQTDWPMMLRIKQAMDPRNLFNPGRLISEIPAATLVPSR
ncbi:MAG: FAD-binding oxidoreductase [Phycisphaeraceae bacterium]|nr:FAD-binding oxidoreductase [Phycisphaeraceae bacterium]